MASVSYMHGIDSFLDYAFTNENHETRFYVRVESNNFYQETRDIVEENLLCVAIQDNYECQRFHEEASSSCNFENKYNTNSRVEYNDNIHQIWCDTNHVDLTYADCMINSKSRRRLLRLVDDGDDHDFDLDDIDLYQRSDKDDDIHPHQRFGQSSHGETMSATSNYK